jgi:hypothetical protein
MKDGTTKLPTFDVYIYQFRILNVPIQPRTDETPDLVTDPARRNSLLLQALGISPDGTIMPEFDLTVKKPECRLKHVKLFKSGTGAPMYHFLLDAKRQRRDRYPQHFVGPLKEDSHPFTDVLLLSSVDMQFILVKEDKRAFPNKHGATNVLEKHINGQLKSYALEVSIRPVIESTDFWQVVDQYSDIEKVRFYIPPPNLPMLDRGVLDGIHEIEETTKSSEASLTLIAGPGESLELSRGDKNLQDLIDVGSHGSKPTEYKTRHDRYWRKIKGQAKRLYIDVGEFVGLFGEHTADEVRKLLTSETKQEQGPKDETSDPIA